MQKIAQKYFKVDPWKIIEKGYDKSKNEVAESIFSIGNEYMGIRGFFEEEISINNRLIGSYFNGIHEYSDEDQGANYKGIIKRTHFMINSVNWLYTKIVCNGQTLDLAHSKFTNFERILDLKSGLLTRSFTWELEDHKQLEVTFKRFVSMTDEKYGYQSIEFVPLNFSGDIEVELGLDFSNLHWNYYNLWEILETDLKVNKIIAKTKTNQLVGSIFKVKSHNIINQKPYKEEKHIGTIYKLGLIKGETTLIEKTVLNIVDKKQADNFSDISKQLSEDIKTSKQFREALEDNQKYFDEFWHKTDITIDGDIENQQGIRYCLFQLEQTYHGMDETNNIGAKGLTGESYSGHAFWDTETYCFPFYLFNNQKAAHHLLMFRYHTLEQAKLRAIDLDCRGACYPIATLNGHEGSSLWQHASLQPQPSTAVAYAIWHYVKITNDLDFLANYGLEMLIEISRYLASRGDFNSDRTKFGFFGVMGPDEFQLMVSHDMYTNYLGKTTIDYTLEALELIKKENNDLYNKVINKVNLEQNEVELFREISEKMHIIYDKDSKIYEQHQGYFDLPHVDISTIPVEDFPLYHNWSYDRIYRNDMIKQPAVLMAMFLYNQSFTLEEKKANYLYYEPRTIHESSLSPSIHSILAAEIGLMDEALEFFKFATRMDLDDYNRNTREGLHTTSIAASWVNIVYGFGGLRSDGKILKLAPKLPSSWNGYSFKINYQGVLIEVIVNRAYIDLFLDKKLEESILLFDQEIKLVKGLNRFKNNQ